MAEVKEVKQVLVVRKDLNMRKGKIAAQVAHASLGAIFSNRNPDPQGNVAFQLNKHEQTWFASGTAKIVVSVNSEEELLKIFQEAIKKNVKSYLVTDAGRTEFHGVPTKTVVAIGPAPADIIDTITGKLSLL
jgi:PTH2 family peptidyl-tRNA hydrolase